jgi:2-methylcitrate dehydratase PrpD
LEASQIESITIEVGKKELSRHDIKEPKDVMIGQYSVPFCVALALIGDANDPRTFRDADVNDERIKSLAARVKLVPHSSPPPSPITSTTIVKTKDGKVLSATVTGFKGTPEDPLSKQELREKFLMLTRHHDAKTMGTLFDRIQAIEAEKALDWIAV